MTGIRKTVGLIAGDGGLPRILADRVIRDNSDVFVIGLVEGISPDSWIAHRTHAFCSVAAPGMMRRILSERGIEHVYLAGGVKRGGVWWRLRPDRQGMRMLPQAVLAGDDDLLGRVADFFAAGGVVVRDPAAYLVDLFAQIGHLGGPALTRVQSRQVRVGEAALASLQRSGIPQACLVGVNMSIHWEGRAGTDALVHRWGRAGACLVKGAKNGQDMRFDIPVIGPRTVREAARTGVSCIAVQARKVLVIDKGRTLSLCRALQVTLVGIHGGDY